MAGKIEQRLEELGVAVPETPAPAGNYVPFVITGNLVFISGQISIQGETRHVGTLGARSRSRKAGRPPGSAD